MALEHREAGCRSGRAHPARFLKVRGRLLWCACWCVYFAALLSFTESSSLIFAAARTFGNFPPEIFPGELKRSLSAEDFSQRGSDSHRGSSRDQGRVSGKQLAARTERPEADAIAPHRLRSDGYSGSFTSEYPRQTRTVTESASGAAADVEHSRRREGPWGGDEGKEKRPTGARDDNWPEEGEQGEAAMQEATPYGESGAEGTGDSSRHQASQAMGTVGTADAISEEEEGLTALQTGGGRTSRGSLKGTFRATDRETLLRKVLPMAGLAALLLGGAVYGGRKLHRKWTAGGASDSAEKPVAPKASTTPPTLAKTKAV